LISYANGNSAKQDTGAPNQVGQPYNFIKQGFTTQLLLEACRLKYAEHLKEGHLNQS
jgi:hypothetical protein